MTDHITADDLIERLEIAATYQQHLEDIGAKAGVVSAAKAEREEARAALRSTIIAMGAELEARDAALRKIKEVEGCDPLRCGFTDGSFCICRTKAAAALATSHKPPSIS